MPDEIDRQLAELLRAGSPPGTSCPADPAEIKRLTLDHLKEFNDEPSWTLWPWDGATADAPSCFVVLLVRPTGFEYACGYGDRVRLSEFWQHDYCLDVDRVMPVLEQRFTLTDKSIHIPLAAAEQWLDLKLDIQPPPAGSLFM